MGLISRKCEFPTNLGCLKYLDRAFDCLAASVDGLCIIVDVSVLEEVDNYVYLDWNDFCDLSIY